MVAHTKQWKPKRCVSRSLSKFCATGWTNFCLNRFRPFKNGLTNSAPDFAQFSRSNGGTSTVSDENAVADDWRNFPITRIRFFAGRTLGSLTPSEIRGLQPWLARVREKWDALDEDIKAHYNAIMQRIAHDAE